jgi:hypothetical protein
MPRASASELVLLAAIALSLIGLGVWLLRNSRVTPAERERRRRLAIHRTGRMGDANITDVRDCVLFYTYEIRGVRYTTTQDASDFRDQLPPERSLLIGPAGLKFTPANPANSIVICEEWSGLRATPNHELEVL